MSENLNLENTEVCNNKTAQKESLLKKITQNKKILALLIAFGLIIFTAIVVAITTKINRAIIGKEFKNTLSHELETYSSAILVEDFNSTNDSVNDEVISQIEDFDQKENNSQSSSNLNEMQPDDDDTVFVPNDMFMLENICEVEILGADFSKKITSPKNLPSHNTFESKKEGYQYLDFKIAYRNLEKALINAEKITSVRIEVGSNNIYHSFSLIEDPNGNLTYTTYTPISSGKIGNLHFLFNVPDEVVNSNDSIVATIVIRGNEYKYVIR